MPKLNLPDIDIEAEAREAAARVAERRTIRAGIDAWQAIDKSLEPDQFEQDISENLKETVNLMIF